jgi:hypothetical protein
MPTALSSAEYPAWRGQQIRNVSRRVSEDCMTAGLVAAGCEITELTRIRHAQVIVITDPGDSHVSVPVPMNLPPAWT